MVTAVREMMEITPAGKMRLNFHPGQWKAWESRARFVVVLAGTQGGKTIFGPHWLFREIKQNGPGDYMVVAPTLSILALKAEPSFMQLFRDVYKLGEYRSIKGRQIFYFSEDGARRTFGEYDPMKPTRVIFGYATKPSTLESATLKGLWCDESGQDDFKPGSWEAIRRRLSISQGRVLHTTTIYNLGWLKMELYDKWEEGDPAVDVIQFDSTENPAFPMDEYHEREASLPRWKFDMMYRGIYTRPAGLIFDCFDSRRHVVTDFPIPAEWPLYAGVDFGGVNTCILIVAEDVANRRLYIIAEYHAGGRTEEEHVKHATKGLPKDERGNIRVPRAWGGSHQEGGWRTAFTLSGLPVQEPEPSGSDSVEVQIQRMYGAFKRNEVMVFRSCRDTLHELATMSRELDERGEPTERIKDEQTYHHMAAGRYVISQLRRDARAPERAQRVLDSLPTYEVH